MATPSTTAQMPKAIRDMLPLIQYITARAKAVPYPTGNTFCQRMFTLLKLKQRKSRIMRKDRPMVVARSPLMVRAFPILRTGAP